MDHNGNETVTWVCDNLPVETNGFYGNLLQKGELEMKLETLIYWMLFAMAIGGLEAEAKTPLMLLEEAQYAEQTEGDLDKAIGLYEQVLDQAAAKERVKAQATYQLGQCYLKKGEKDKAAKYFQEAANFYPDQKSILQKAMDQLKKIYPEGQQDPTMQVIGYLQQQHMHSYKKAKAAGIQVNSIAYYVDERGSLTQGGFLTFENDSGVALNSEMPVGNFSHTKITECYNEVLAPQQIRFEDTGSESGRYAMMWTPDQEFGPGQVRTLLYKYPDDYLKKDGKGFRLEMSNHFGPEVLENFFVILPPNMKIVKGLNNLTSHTQIGGHDVYLWQKRVPKNTTNTKMLELEIKQEFADSAKPVVINTIPATYSNDVDPELTEISVTFDQDMFQHGWAWCQSGRNENYPEVTGTPQYTDSRTCVLPVKLKPAQNYLVMVNCKNYKSFRNIDEVPAREYVIVFATADENGNPTEIQPGLLKKAEVLNERNAIPEPVLDEVPAAVRAYIAGKFYETHQEALSKGLRTNSHVHLFDEQWNRNMGVIQIFKNTTGKALNREIQMGANDSADIYIYDDEGIRQKIRTTKIPGSNYRFFWTPSRPVEPDEERMLFHSAGTRQMKVDDNGVCKLKMGNHFGMPVIEDFYLVLPAGIKLIDQSEVFTSHETIEGYDIYCWSKEQGLNEKHLVEVKLAKTND